MGEMTALAQRLFGPEFDLFQRNGLWYVGRFTDGKGPFRRTDPPPWKSRTEEIFGCGRDVGELFAFMGPERTWSIPGLAPVVGDRRGYTPTYDRYGRIVAWKSPAGVFYAEFPGARSLGLVS